MVSITARLEGLLLRVVAALIGARVTSWIRSESENARVGGHPQSKHLSGCAVDVGKETPEWQRAILRTFAKEIDETVTTKGSGAHYHYQVDGRAMPMIVALGGIFGLWWGVVMSQEGKR